MKAAISIFSAVLAILNFSSYAQTVQWQKILGNSSANESINSSAKVHKNLYVHAGSYETITPYQYQSFLLFTNANGDSLYSYRHTVGARSLLSDIVVNKDKTITALGVEFIPPSTAANFAQCYDTLGNILWTKHYNQPGNGGEASHLELLPDGYLLLTNKTINTQAYTSSSHVIRTDLQGNMLWQRNYGPNSSLRDATLLKDGSYMLLGWSTDGSSSAVTPFYQVNIKLTQITPHGDTIQTKVIGNPTNREMGNSIKQTSDGGFVIVGDYVENVNRTKRQGYVVKLDSLLNMEWDLKIMPDRGDADDGCELHQVQETTTGEFVVAGNFWEQQPYHYRSYVARINSTGQVVWNQRFGQPYLPERFYSMIYDSTGAAYLTGYSSKTMTVDFYQVKITGLPLPYQPDYCNAPLQAAFNVQAGPDSVKFTDQSQVSQSFALISKWEWDFGDGTSRTIYDEAAALSVMHKYQQPYSQLAGTPVRLIVTNNLFCSDTLTLYPWGAPTAVTKELQQLPTRLYPQPMQQQAVLQVQGLEQHEELKVEVTDMLGRVQQLPFTVEEAGEQTKLHLQRNNLASGMYLYRLLQKNEVLSVGKLVVQ